MLAACQVAPKARAALHVHEAQLALLLALVQGAMSPDADAMIGGGGGHRLAAITVITELAHCQASLPACCKSMLAGMCALVCSPLWRIMMIVLEGSTAGNLGVELYIVFGVTCLLQGCPQVWFLAQAVDLQPEEPRADSKTDTSSLRVRLGRFNIAVLRVANASVAGLPDSEQVSFLKLLYLFQSKVYPETAICISWSRVTM